ncbi:hypothetical protein Bca52824_012031 [Brassica carinata]|uniref:Uncharacterized protein n=1 Tax=Brassica carinata TaxID=52824 RepID=A0A8X8B201_BRACI|nr:hypothetical protein Bca52824_012031 [Brassica carinata]
MARRLNASLISILLITASLSPPSHSLILDSLSIGRVEIYGLVRCNLEGDPNAPPISNGTVILRCGGLTANLAETLTNPGGVCNIAVVLPTGNCSISSPDGVLTGVLTLLSVAVTNNTNVATFGVGTLDNIL